VCCKEWFIPNSPSQKYCIACRESGRAEEYYKAHATSGICLGCGKKIASGRYWCKAAECRAKHKAYKEQHRKEQDDKKSKKYKQYKSLRRNQKITQFYPCRVCGKNAFPNRFFCKTCHAAVSTSGMDVPYAVCIPDEVQP